MNKKYFLISIPIIISIFVVVTIVEENKKNRILEIEQRIEQIKIQAIESENFISDKAYLECRKEIPRYSSGLITAQKYYPVVNECYNEKIIEETRKLEKLIQESEDLTKELEKLQESAIFKFSLQN